VRQSVICRCPDGRLRLYIKGADDVIFARLAADQPYAEVTMTNLQDFASAGLRTLCCAYAELDEEAYHRWNKEYKRAAVAILLREQRVRRIPSVDINSLQRLTWHSLFFLGV
jgi:phospholipid-transporting ATPase